MLLMLLDLRRRSLCLFGKEQEAFMHVLDIVACASNAGVAGVWLFVRESEVQCGGTDAAVGMAG